MKVFAIVPSAGSGRRMNSVNDDKPFLEIDGKPLFIFALLSLDNSKAIDDITVVVKKKYAKLAEEFIEMYGIKKVGRILPGGDTRTQSVQNGLDAIKAKKDDLVVIHDGARPFLSEEMLKSSIKAAKESGAAVVGMPLTSTIKELDERQFVKGTRDRSKLFEAQTPQVFRYGVIKKAYQDVGDISITDDSAVVERAGYKVKVVQGSRRNIKVTVAEDVALAEAILESTKLKE